MKKNILTKIVPAVIAATTMVSFSSLGVSAKTYNSKGNTHYNLMAKKLLKTGWIMNNGKWYYFNSAGLKQTGVINVKGKTYCLNSAGVLETGKIKVNNVTYTTASNGQVIGTKAPAVDKVFDSTNNVVKDTNQNSTVVGNSTTNQGTTTNTGTTSTGTTTNAGTTTNTTTENTNNTGTTTNTGNTTTEENTTNVETTTNTTNTGSTTTTDSTTNSSTAGSSVDVQGLPQLPTKYSINVQATAEQKILQLMNEKRVEAGLKPLTMDNTLLKVARYKSNHMIQYNYFDHTNPDGTKWVNWLQTIGYKYTATGENIAYNTYDAVELFNQWWNSPGHRANMMNASYGKVGIGVIQGNGKYMGTQTFSN